MGNSSMGRQWNLIIWWLGLLTHPCFLLTNSLNFDRRTTQEDSLRNASGVHLLRQNQREVIMSNGLVKLTLTPGGQITNVTYKGSDNLLASSNIGSRGYWDIVWNKHGEKYITDQFSGTSYKMIVQNNDQTEISFTRTWKTGSSEVPLNMDIRYVMLRDSPGFYSYAVFERLKGWPAFEIQEARLVFKLHEKKFEYMAMSDERQRVMPKLEDLKDGEVLDYPEAILITHPTNPQIKGEVDDKYFYSCDNKDNKVHGWVSNDPAPVGFWLITPSDEFRIGGPFKQDLTSHIGPTTLSMFISTHYAGDVMALKFQNEEYWKKVFGPVYFYLNSDVSAKADPSILWKDAKQRMQKEAGDWPYNFPLSNDFIKSNQRGAVSGQFFVHDGYKNKKAIPGASAYVGLAPPGDAGSWQMESKGYQFWTQADGNGNFIIKNVIPGTYSLFACVYGTLGDYKHSSDITIAPGSNINVRNMVFEAPRNGATLWEIGIPDRTAAEFFIPDPDPRFKIHPYPRPIEKFREYGLWKRYKDYHPQSDLIFTIGQSNYAKDWFFAHVTRNVKGQEYEATTWQILFNLDHVNKEANYTLQLALASADQAELQVRINDPKSPPQFTTGNTGNDNALARHGIHGLYRLYSVGIAGSRFVDGKNTIFLTQAVTGTPFREVMYDYIRLEGPA